MNRPSFSFLIPPRPQIEQVKWLGLLVLVGFLGGFLIWAIFFPLETGVVAPGKIVLESSRKEITHLEGGIVKSIYVQEGTVVQQGEKLIELDSTQTQANLDILKTQTRLYLARMAWLQAARDNAENVTFPEELLKEKDNPEVQQVMKSAEALFLTQKQAIIDGINILNSRIEQLRNQKDSEQAQVQSADTQLQLNQQELDAVLYLEKENYIDKPRVLSLKRQAAQLQGERDNYQAQVAKTEQQIGETEIQIISLKDSKKADVLKQLEVTEIDLANNLEKETAVKDVLKRSLIVAPIAGTVLDLKVHTIGGTIGPREPIMEIVPAEDKLIVEARVRPQDIESVHVGLITRIRLIAYKVRHTPTVDGRVVVVDADITRDERSNESFYLVRIEVDAKELSNLPNVSLYPGMPVQANIIIEKHTLLDYLLIPIYDSFSRAFKEK